MNVLTMKRLIPLLSVLVSITLGIWPAKAADTTRPDTKTWGDRREMSFADLKAGFANPPMAYAPFMFWFWDTPLTPESKAMAAEMAAMVSEQRIIAAVLRPGKNTLRIRVGNLIANSLGLPLEAGLFGPVTLKPTNR